MKNRRALKKLNQVDLGLAVQKRNFNQDLFEEVAPVYDSVTPMLSLGQDRRWKARLAGWLPTDDRLPSPSGAVCLDLACGTGDFCQLLEGRYVRGAIFGLDLSGDMMSKGRSKFASDSNTRFLKGDMGRIPLRTQSVDIITGGYALRNAPDLAVALEEISRVLRPDGQVAILDFSKSHSKIVQWLQLRILSFWGNIWGFLFHRNPEVYGYLARSLSHFPDHQAFGALLDDVNLEVVRQRAGMMGLIRLMLLKKNTD